MGSSFEHSSTLGSPVSQFNTTHWSVVLSAQDPNHPQFTALETLCRAYWRPLYAYVRRRGYSPHAAQDLTQGFFEQILQKDYLRSVDRKKGKFRSFLLASIQHFLANEWRNARTQKRGGGAAVFSLNDTHAEQHYSEAASADLTAERLFERQWATSLLEQVLAKLRLEFAASGKGAQFEQLKVFLTGEKGSPTYAAMAEKLNTTPAALKMAVSRMRQRYGELLRAEIARTVPPGEVEEELNALFAALSS